MSREQELVWAIEVQTECLEDLKRQLTDKQRIIQLQQTLLTIRSIEMEKQRREIQTLQIEKNYEWN
jgi:hypothetical protein